MPVAYLTGTKEFWGLELTVDTNVLIPRADTETLVELVLDNVTQQQQFNILDLGTGSGAIALAIAHERPKAKVFAVDASIPALKIAKLNAAKHRISNIEFLQSNWFAVFGNNNIYNNLKFDIIVSNPPYIADNDLHLINEDIKYEPKSALVSENNGLADLSKIIIEAKFYLKPQGILMLEHGYNQAEQVKNILEQNAYKNIFTRKDLNNIIRVTGASFL